MLGNLWWICQRPKTIKLLRYFIYIKSSILIDLYRCHQGMFHLVYLVLSTKNVCFYSRWRLITWSCSQKLIRYMMHLSVTMMSWVWVWLDLILHSAQRCILPVFFLVDLPFRWIYFYGNNKSTRKETRKMHHCAVFWKLTVAIR